MAGPSRWFSSMEFASTEGQKYKRAVHRRTMDFRPGREDSHRYPLGTHVSRILFCYCGLSHVFHHNCSLEKCPYRQTLVAIHFLG